MNNYYSTIIIDLNNLYWRCLYTSLKKNIDNERDEIYSESIRDTLSRVKGFLNDYGKVDSTVYICCDNPFSKINERKMISPTYKHSRDNKKIPANFYHTLEMTIEILKCYSDDYVILQEPNLEADDLVPIITRDVNVDHNNMCLLVSNDLDWSRSINEYTNWYDHANMYDIKSFTKKYGFSPEGNNIQMYKSIRGDKSDCIDNAIPHLPEKVVLDLIKYDTIKEMMMSLDSDDNITDNQKTKIRNAENKLKINFQLTGFLNIDNLSLDEISIKGKENIKSLKYYYKLLDIEFENRMRSKKNSTKNFFTTQKTYKRIKA